jgi:5'-nucleotidase
VRGPGGTVRKLRIVAVAVTLLVVASGCTLLKSADRYAASPSTVAAPFWCKPTSGTALSIGDCRALSAQLDVAVFWANSHHTASRATADGATSSPYVTGVGAPFRFRGATATFDPIRPDTLLYDGTTPNAQVAGIEFNVKSASAPAGFAGPNDVWTKQADGTWRLRVWILRPFQNEPNVFAATHACLAASGAVYDVTAGCYTATHPNPLNILVSNDDGYANSGIDHAVEALRTLPNVKVTVSAPATNQSGTGGNTSPDPLTATDVTTLSGYPAKAVQGFPADAARYGLQYLKVNPDLLVSGINEGQNLSVPITNISGTVGAARVGARDSIPAVAISQGLGSPPDFDAGADALMAWVDDFLLGRAGPSLFQYVVNINVPTCTTGAVRGTAFVPAATNFDSGNPITTPSNCTSTLTNPVDDIQAFVNGFVSLSSIGPNP